MSSFVKILIFGLWYFLYITLCCRNWKNIIVYDVNDAQFSYQDVLDIASSIKMVGTVIDFQIWIVERSKPKNEIYSWERSTLETFRTFVECAGS